MGREEVDADATSDVGLITPKPPVRVYFVTADAVELSGEPEGVKLVKDIRPIVVVWVVVWVV